ncbi:MAG: beta-galactosidase [Clostridia bacterium]|nr:beta-galactosidase [Clostridia bacterium]
MFAPPRLPYLGVAYYPEDWPDSEMDKDIARMKQVGINVARIGEFAWHRMEPRQGEYDFSYFHMVIDKLKSAGIGVVMGTPTATPPRWLGKRYPDVYKENAAGQRAQHGGRRDCCSNNLHYNEYSMRIVEAMAREFGGEEGIIGWQIDNEIYTGDLGCFCPDCVARFREKLKAEYGSIDALNEAWNHNIFSQWYDEFDDIPAPRASWQNPHLLMAWRMFQNESHVAFVRRQAEILHRYVKVPVGTDSMPVNGMNYRDMNRTLDVVEFNHYNTPENLYGCAFWFDYLRTMKDRPFWNTETATCWNGSTAISQSVKPEGYCRANSWLPIALGGEANMYWLWRTHWGGHELVHGAVLDTSGREMHTTGEVREVAAGYAAARDFINGTKVRADLGIHFTSLNWNMNLTQEVVKDLHYMKRVQDHWYKPAVDKGLRPDVIDAEAPLDGYKIIVSPLMMSMEEHDLPARMAEWVRAGGVWLVGPLTDVRDHAGARYKDRFYGTLEELTGVTWRYGLPDTEHRIRTEWHDGTPFEGDVWYELSDADVDSALVKVTAGHSALIGKSLLTLTRVGQGYVLQLGSIPSISDMGRIIDLCLKLSGVTPLRTEGQIMVSPRAGDGLKGYVLVEYGAQPAACVLDRPMKNLLTGETLCGRVDVEPYGALVLSEV